MRQQRGFTLIELLVVLVIIAVVWVGVSLSLRQNPRELLEKDAQRLIAQLEAARSVSRASGVAWGWHAQGNGYVIQALPELPQASIAPTTWYSAGVQTRASATDGRVVLGPEPIIAPAWIDLFIFDGKTSAQVRIATDGLRSFEVRP